MAFQRPQRSSFGSLLERYRRRAELTQAELAERAGVSIVTIGALERGVRRSPYVENTKALADALDLSGAERQAFEDVAAASRPRRPPIRAERPGDGDNLPLQSTSFVGRDKELAQVADLLQRYRLVTITGSGGVGKTRGALEVAARITQPVRLGVYFCDLSAAVTAEDVNRTLSSVLKVSGSADADLLPSITAALASRAALLVLDNCEHVLEGAAVASATIVSACPNIKLLATSRERLNVPGEAIYRLPSLGIPPKDCRLGVDDARTYSAVALFEERALATEAGFTLTEASVETVAAICRRLEGIPLAIELAAARLPALGLTVLRERLDRHFRVLGRNGSTAPARQQTLDATIGWSCDLLGDLERLLLVRLTVFSGPWTIVMAETICGDPPLNRELVLELVMALVDKSLVNIVDLSCEPPQLRILATTWTFVRERIANQSDIDAVVDRHITHYRQRLSVLGAQYNDSFRQSAITSLFPEADEIRAAIDRAMERGNVYAAADIFAATPMWHLLNCHTEESVRALALLDRLDPSDGERRAALRLRLANAATNLGQTELALTAAEAARADVASSTNRALRAWVLSRYAFFASRALQFEAVQQSLDEAQAEVDSLRSEGAPPLAILGSILEARGKSAELQGNLEMAASAYESLYAMSQTLGNRRTESMMAIHLAGMAHARGKTVEGIRILTERLATQTPDDPSSLRATILVIIAGLCVALDRTEETIAAAQEATSLLRERGLKAITAVALEHTALALLLRGDPRRAVRVAGYADACFATFNGKREDQEQLTKRRLTDGLERLLSSVEIAEGLLLGAAMTEEEIIQEAFG